MISSLLARYLQDKVGSLPILIQKCEDPKVKEEENAFLLPLSVATHFITEEKNDAKAIQYLEQSLQWKPTPLASYQLAYVYEMRLRETLKDCKDKKDATKPQLLDLVEMLTHYEMAAQYGDGKAMNQLGSFFIDFDFMPSHTMAKTPEQYLLQSQERKIPQATANLIRLYRKTNQYKKLVNVLQEKLKRAPDSVETLLDLILTMLNQGDYAGYCRFVKGYQGGTQNVLALLRKGATCGVQPEECPVCLVDKPCFKLACSHLACNDCLFEIFAGPREANCPICRASLQ